MALFKVCGRFRISLAFVNRNVLTCFVMDACSFTDNDGLCGIPGLPTCRPHLSAGGKVGIAVAAVLALFLLVMLSIICWKRRQNITRAQQIAGNTIASHTNLTTEPTSRHMGSFFSYPACHTA